MNRKVISGMMLILLSISMVTMLVRATALAESEQIITHTGDLIIDGNQTFTIENCTYIQTGNVYVKDQATLIIQNAELQLNQTERFQYSVFPENSAHLYIDTGTITSSLAFYAIYARNNAEIYVNHWNKSTVTCFHGIVGGDNVDVKIENSNMWCPEYPWYSVSASHLSILNSKIGLVNAFTGSACNIVNSTIWSLSGQGIYLQEPPAQVSVVSSQVGTIGFSTAGYPPPSIATISIDGLKPGTYSFWNTYQNLTTTHGFNITLIDTSVDHWRFLAYNCDFSVVDSILFGAELGAQLGGTLEANIQQSVFESSLQIWFEGNVSVSDSILGGFVCSSGEGVILAVNNVTFSRYFLIVDSPNIYMYGNASYREAIDAEIRFGYLEQESFFTRNFNVICLNQTTPLVNLQLRLYDENETLVWSGSTDSQGYANFNLTYTNSNYTKTHRLEATKQDFFSTHNVTFISDTPILSGTRTFYVIKNQTTYAVTTFSNSSITNFNYNETLSQISFNVTGPSDTVGFTSIAVQKDLGGTFEVVVDGIPVIYTQTENSTHYFLYFTYQHSTHIITITIGPSPSNLIEELIKHIKQMNLKQGITNSLDAKLSVTLASLEALNSNKRNDAINKLEAMINETEAQRENMLSNEQADYIISEALEIIDLIEG